MAEGINFEELHEDLVKFQQDEVVREALLKGVDLGDYSRQIDEELKDVELLSVADYVFKSEDIAALHSEIGVCDGILEGMQHMLGDFQTALGGISAEIKQLQEQSMTMNIKLRNRKAVEAKVSMFVDKIVVKEELIKAICEDPVDEKYQEYLVALANKLRFVELDDDILDHGVAPADTAAAEDVRPVLARLRNAAVSRVREYCLSQFAGLKKVMTHSNMVKATQLLSVCYFYEFLETYDPAVAEEVKDAYRDTMSRVLANVYKTYYSFLNRMAEERATKFDRVCVEESISRGMFASKLMLSEEYGPLMVGDRIAALDEVDEPAVAEGKVPYEMVFKRVQIHLIKSAITEFQFIREFFHGDRELFVSVFAKAMSIVLENVENYLFDAEDAIALLMMLRITHSHKSYMAVQGLDCLESYFMRVNMMLWPRFKAVFESHVMSLREATPRRLGVVTKQPHYVAHRYAEFSASMHLLLMEMEGGEETLYHNVAMLRAELERLLVRLSSSHRGDKDRIVFLINNYDHILRVLGERRVEADSPQFEEMLEAQIMQYVEEELHLIYGRLVAFVKQTTAAIEAEDDGPRVEIDTSLVESLVRNFASSWKGGIESIHDSVVANFPDLRDPTDVLTKVLTQLLLYYTRFQDIIKRSYAKPPPFYRDILPIQTIVHEMKKYSFSG
eukprot:PLAT7068.2.p1 GENE.PLAT7068.2~~PLAT7068.2.p1  ORF type:complete len:697 (-),score=327.43 PLAT7068.2:62-2080(-)